MRKITTIEELIEELETVSYNYYGLRGATAHDLEIIASGRDYLDCSQDNWAERDCDWHDEAEMLNGTSALAVDEYMADSELMQRYNDALGYAQCHHTTQVVLLVADKCAEEGTDPNEIVIGSNGCGANVIAVVEIAA